MTNQVRALHALEAWYGAHLTLRSLETPMSAHSIKSLSGQIARVKAGVQSRVAQVGAALDRAEKDFHVAADGSESFVRQVSDYTAELQSMTADLTNGGPSLDDEATFPVPDASGGPAAVAPVASLELYHGVPVSGRAAVIETMHQLGREHG